jgi:diguanylate cyclase (GGDEF)-like protein/PAS domain S-box-containing protein
MRDGQIDNSSDFLLLYELSLSIGRSLDLADVCREFVDVLMARTDLSYSAVWLASPLQLHAIPEATGYELICAVPEMRAAARYLEADHASFHFGTGETYRSLEAGDPDFDAVVAEHGVKGGSYALFRLGDLGLLKLYSHRGKRFSALDLKQLQTVVEKFTIAVRGALAHQRLRIESAERESAERFLDLLLQLSSRFINLPLDKIDASIQSALEKMARFIEADRAYLFDYDFEAGTTSNTFEWCAPGISPQLDALQAIPLSDIPEWVEAHVKGRPMDIPDVGALPSGHLRDMLEAQEIKGLLVLPLMGKEGCLGFVGFDAVRHPPAWGEKARRLLHLFAGMLVNIAERRHTEERLRLAASVFTHASEGILITDAEGTILEVNDAFTRVTGYAHDEVLGKNPRILKSGRHRPAFYAALWNDLVRKGHWYGEIWNRRKNGEIYAELLNISAVRDRQGNTRNYVALFTDITQQKEHQRQLERIAHYDTLTGLPNRVLLADRLRQAMAQTQRRGQQLAVVYLDLDGFKAINDAHGHHIGDKLLVALATRLRQALRRGDTIARLGGDEFIVVLIDLVDSKESVPLLTRLLGAAAQPVPVGDLTLQVSASLGATFYPQAEAVDADQLLRQADQAMYQAKLGGKNRYQIFDTQQNRHIRGQYEHLERIRLALDENEFVLYYQPKVNMRTGEIVGVEALIRWQHPEQGLLLPALFLPVIENHPLGIELGEWVLDSALAQIETWHAAGLNLSVSVNVGANQLQQIDFTERLRARLEAHPGVRPGDLILEILETSALEDMAYVSQVMDQCGGMGVQFALDDFGTGYSSLIYLKSLPAAQLKIDRSFVRDMLDDPDDLSIIDGVLGLASAFRRQPIAEGVEAYEHGVLLLRLGCELAQGFAIARPMPAAELPVWIDTWRPDPGWAEQQPFERDDLPLLFAGVEHRAWIRAVEACLRGEHVAPPEMDRYQCRLGRWLDGDGQARYGARPVFQTVEQLHWQVHALAKGLLEGQEQEQNQEGLSGLDQLHGLRDRLLGQLDALAESNDVADESG